MSALPLKADIGTQPRDVRFVPEADIGTQSDHVGDLLVYRATSACPDEASGQTSATLLATKGARQMTFTERGFRDALGLFPTGVAVVTTVTKDGTRIGATVSSFNSVSLSPPLVLFSIARTSRSFAAWSDADTYAINLLHEHQHAVSTRFARSLAEKWEGVVPLVGHTGAPLIPGALASFECENYARHDGGDHLILVGKVCALTTATAGDVRPLIFYRGSYQKIERDYDPNTPSDFYYLLNGW